jgi:hypothetical protein
MESVDREAEHTSITNQENPLVLFLPIPLSPDFSRVHVFDSIIAEIYALFLTFTYLRLYIRFYSIQEARMLLKLPLLSNRSLGKR